MKVLITGSKGFIGKNLTEFLKTKPDIQVLEYDTDTPDEDLKKFTKICDIVVNLAGVNRTNDIAEFEKGNFGVISHVVEYLKEYKNKAPIIYSSSIMALLDNEYGKSKQMAEDFLFDYSKTYKVPVYIYRFTNIFGKWGKPNYNSVVSTFCYNISRNLPIKVDDKTKVLTLSYIDDVVFEIYNAILGKPNLKGIFCEVEKQYKKSLGEIVELLEKFKSDRESLEVINTANEFEKKLYSTYLSYLDGQNFSYDLNQHTDNRGSFTEIIRSKTSGQFSVNIAKPNITKGNHWHNTKNEKFLVVSGKASIKFRLPFSKETIEYIVSGEKMEVVDIPCGYTHSITNIGDSDMIFFIWTNECFDKENPDTFYLEV